MRYLNLYCQGTMCVGIVSMINWFPLIDHHFIIDQFDHHVHTHSDDQKKPEYMNKFPLALVPGIQDGDFALAES